MKQPILSTIKFWAVILVIAIGLYHPMQSSAQPGAWSILGGSSPYSKSQGGSLENFCLLSDHGLIYAPYHNDSAGTISLAIYNGTGWQQHFLPSNFDANENFDPNLITAIAADASGNIYMAGNATDTSGAIVIKWDGSTFTKVGNGANGLHTNNGYVGGFVSNWITALCFDQAGNLYAGGYFADAQGHEYVAKWDGTSWTTVGSTTDLNMPTFNSLYFGEGLSAYGNDLYAKGTNGIIKWNGTSWSNIDVPGSNVAYGFSVGPTGNIYGVFGTHVSKWDGTSWTRMGVLADSLDPVWHQPSIYKAYTDTAENVYIMGSYTDSAGYYYVAKWDGSQWNELGAGASGLHANYMVNALVTSGAGPDSIFVTGGFTTGVADTSGVPYVALYTSAVSTGIRAVNDNASVQVYPNPTSGMLNIRLDKAFSGIIDAKLYDVQGQLISSANGSNDFNMDLSDCAAGLYYLHVQADGISEVRKVEVLK